MNDTRVKRRDVVIIMQLLAIVLLLVLVVTQVHVDDEPYPCTPIGVQT